MGKLNELRNKVLAKVQDDEEKTYLFKDEEYTLIELKVPFTNETETAKVIGVCLTDNEDVEVMAQGVYSGYDASVSLDELSDEEIAKILSVLA